MRQIQRFLRTNARVIFAEPDYPHPIELIPLTAEESIIFCENVKNQATQTQKREFIIISSAFKFRSLNGLPKFTDHEEAWKKLDHIRFEKVL
jgi:hypothetical protein